MYCIFMDAKNQVLGIEKMFTGSITNAPIYPREIVKHVLSMGATALVMAHNHPSGCVVASAEDRAITVKVYVALASIDTALARSPGNWQWFFLHGRCRLAENHRRPF